MRYIYLIYTEEQPVWNNAADDRFAAAETYGPFVAETRRAGVYVSGSALQPTLTATTLSKAGDMLRLADGPAVKTPLALSGYYVLDVADERDALRWAAKIPGARAGAVELRKVSNSQ